MSCETADPGDAPVKLLLSSMEGRWKEFFIQLGMPEVILDTKGHPCPRCGGTDRFAVFPDFSFRGSAHCRYCFHKHTKPHPGDGIATIQWWLACTPREAVQKLKDFLGISRDNQRLSPLNRSTTPPVAETPKQTDWDSINTRLMSQLEPENLRKAAESLSLPESCLKVLQIGWSQKYTHITWPMRSEDGAIVGVRTRSIDGRKYSSARWSTNGLFYSPDLLGRTLDRLWIAEGPTDTAALVSLGCDACGLPCANAGHDVLERFCRKRRPKEVVIVADNDCSGKLSAEQVADSLLILVRCVRVIHPPAPHKDARDWVKAGARVSDLEKLAASVFPLQLKIEVE